MSTFGKPTPDEQKLEAALWAGDFKYVQQRLKEHPDLVTEINYLNSTWLLNAVGVSTVAIVELLIEAGSDVNFTDAGDSPIHSAIERNVPHAGRSKWVGARTDWSLRTVSVAQPKRCVDKYPRTHKPKRIVPPR